MSDKHGPIYTAPYQGSFGTPKEINELKKMSWENWQRVPAKLTSFARITKKESTLEDGHHLNPEKTKRTADHGGAHNH